VEQSENLPRGAEARTPDDLLTAIGDALSKGTAKDAAHWFAHRDYSFN